jgi:F-type H+-transporting ATPase subunit b
MAGKNLARWVLVLGLGFWVARASAQDHRPGPPPPSVHAAPFPGALPGPAHRRIDQMPAPHEPAAEHEKHEKHAAHAAHDESAPPEPINWWHGLLGEKEGVTPNLMWRAPGDPPPFLASVINFGLLAFIIVVYGKKPLAAALSRRKETILRDIEESKRLREEAEKRLAEYEAKLDKINEELERIRREFREQGERDKQRIVAEANERRERMKKDADFLLAQEWKQMRQDLVAQTVDEATRLAADLLSKRLTQADQDRFAETFLAELRSGSERGGGAGSSYEAVAKGGPS